VTPALKSRLVDALQRRGHFVAMVGDGSNDIPALMSADVAVAMASGTATARAVADIVLLDDSFAALIRGTREATFVLGNTARLSKLFMAKSVYAYVLILATNMLGLDFPFLPRQGGIVSGLTLGIPAIFIAIGVPPRRVRSNFAPDVLRFALPAGLALAIVAMLAQFATEGLLGRPIEEARTLVSLTIVVTGLAFVVEILGFEAADWRRPWRPLLTLGLAGALLGVLVVTMAVGPLRTFFAFTSVSTGEWVVVLVASTAALGGQYVLSRYWRQIIEFLVAAPSADEVARGRSE
jgi:magnesium-transporting ATPase (P-type)